MEMKIEEPASLTVLEELSYIEQKFGNLRPETVVEFAKNPETALHKKFVWDDTEAAKKWRVHQARRILRVHVRMAFDEHPEPIRVRAFVSLYNDRGKNKMGYRPIQKVMGNDDLRDQLLSMAKRDMQTFINKYKNLVELSGVIDAMKDALGE